MLNFKLPGRCILGLFFIISPLLWAEEPISLNSLFIPEAQSQDSLYANVMYTFSGAVAGSINYAQLCVATDSTCSTCIPAPYRTITSGSPIPYTASGTTYSISPAAIARSLNSFLFAAGTYNIRLLVQSLAPQCSATNTAYCSANQNTSAEFTCLSAVYNGSTVTSLTSNYPNTNISLQTPKRAFAYVAENVLGLVQKCSVNPTNGGLTGCAPTALSISRPSGITVTTINDVQYAYIVSQVLIGTASIRVCPITSGSVLPGSLTTCETTFPINFTNAPHRMAFSTINGTTYAYVATGINLYKCLVSSGDGTLSGCTIEVTYPSSLLRAAVTTATINGVTYLYYSTSTTVNKCTILSDGSVTSCAPSPVTQPSWTLSGISITSVNNVYYAYLASNPSDPAMNAVYACQISNSGDLSNCAIAASSPSVIPTWSPSNVTFEIANGVQYAYVTDVSGGKVFKCDVNSDASLDPCVQTPTLVLFPVATDTAFAYVDVT